MPYLSKEIILDPKEFEFIKQLEKLAHVRCYIKQKIKWNSRTIENEKQINPLINIVIINEKITELVIIGARITKFPEFKEILLELKKLYIMKTSLEIFPNSVTELKELRDLDLSFNKINEIPSSITKLKKLESLNISQNSLNSISNEILSLPSLKKLKIKGNPIYEVPSKYPKLDQLIDKYRQGGLNISEAEVLANLEIMTGETLNQVHHRGILNGYYIQNKSIVWLRLFNINLKTLPRIISNLKNLKTLNLSGEPAQEIEGKVGRRNGIEFIPETIGDLNNLIWLYLSKAMIKSIPEEIGMLSNLQHLYLSDNLLENLPISLSNLKSLKSLDIKKNNLNEIPKWIGNFKNLEILNIGFNKIQDVPKELSKLKNLKSLILEENFIKEIPSSIGKLIALRNLDLSNNNLISESLTPVYHLKNLRRLDISYNTDIFYLAESVGDIENLEFLNIEGNQFISVPTSIWKLKKLRELKLRNNPWDDENSEIINRDLQYILEYCRKKANIHVFLSHAVEDFNNFHLLELIKFLENQPEIYEILYCERDLTGNIDQFMKENIPKSNLLLFLATKKSVYDSEDCKTEIKLARQNEIEIIPIKSEEVTWEDLMNVGLKRELGKEFNENIQAFGKELYDYIINFKHNVNLFEKERAKIEKIRFMVKKEFERIINTHQADDYFQNNYEILLEKMENNEEKEKEFIDLMEKLLKFNN